MTNEITQADIDEQKAIAQMTFDAQLTDAEIGEVSEALPETTQNNHAWFRASLAVMARSSEELEKLASDDVGGALDITLTLIEGINSTIASLEREVELMEAAKIRCLIMASKHASVVEQGN